MADEKILLEIEFNNNEVKDAIKNIAAGRKTIDELVEANKKLAAQGQKNSVEYVKNAESIKALTVEVNQNSKIVQANTQANKANADSIEKVKAENVLLIAERKKLDATTTEGAKRLQEINTNLDKNNNFLDANLSKTEKQNKSYGQFSGVLSTISPQLGGFAGNLDTAQQSSGGLTSGLVSMTKAALGFILTPLGAVIAAIVLGFKALQTFLTGSEEGMDLLARASAQLSAVFSVLKNTVVQIGGALAAFATGNFAEGVDKLTGAFENLDGRIKDAVGSAGELADIMDVLDELRLQAQVRNDEESNQIKNLIIQSRGRLLTEKQRNDLLAQASAIEKKLTGEKLAQQIATLNASTRQFLVDSDRLDLAQKEGETTIDFTKRIIASQDLLYDKRKGLADQLGEYNSLLGEQANVQEKIQNQQDAIAEKAEAEAAKRAEAEAKRLEEIAKKQEEIRQRTLSAENELEIARLSREARQIQGLENQTDKLIEIEQTKLEQQLENTELVEAERQKLIFESEEAINEILAESREREQAERLMGLENSLSDFQEYTQGLVNAEKEKYLQGIISKEEYDQQIADLEVAALETQLAIKEAAGEQDLALEGRLTDYKIALGEKEVQAKKLQENAKISAVQNAIGTIAGAFNKQSVAYKVLASIQTSIDTIRGAFNVFTGMTSAIPGPVGIVLGLAAAAATTASGIAAVSKINATQVPKMEEGGAMEISGKRHSQGGEDVTIGGKRVANVERGEKMVILKRGANPGLLKNLSAINALAGGKDFYHDRAPVYRNQDGGFVARSAAQQARQFTTDAQQVVVKSVLQVSELHRVEDNISRAEVTSELR
jgi:hypothetical protein